MKRTKEIESKLSELEGLKVFFEEMRENAQEKFDEKPLKWQESDKGEEWSANIDSLDEAVNNLEAAYGALEEAF